MALMEIAVNIVYKEREKRRLLPYKDNISILFSHLQVSEHLNIQLYILLWREFPHTQWYGNEMMSFITALFTLLVSGVLC